MPGFGDRVIAILRERKMRQADLARLMRCKPQYVSTILARKTVTVRTIRAVAAALQLPPSALHTQTATASVALTKCRARLDRARLTVGASSCTLYLRDPHWVDEFVLAAMSNVRYPEPMHGVLSPSASRALVLAGDKPEFIEDTTVDPRLFPPAPQRSEIPASVRHLFGTFAQREGVVSMARLPHFDQSRTKAAILFVNFSDPQIFDALLRRRLNDILVEILSDLPAIHADLSTDHSDWLSEATRILSPRSSVANIDLGGVDDPNPFFHHILRGALEAFGISETRGLGTLHLYNPENNTLELRASCGSIQYPERAALHSVTKGQGVVSWVALRGRPLLISDLLGSREFRQIHVCLNDNVRSELAVPLQIAGETIGVMCLECIDPGYFQPHHVKSAWYAANRAAVAYQLHQQVAMNRDLLELCSHTVTGNAAARSVLDGLSILARRYLKASFADIWSYDSKTQAFSLAGASVHDAELVTRGDLGFNEYVRATATPILLSDILGTQARTIHHWRPNPPNHLNRRELSASFSSRIAAFGQIAVNNPVTAETRAEPSAAGSGVSEPNQWREGPPSAALPTELNERILHHDDVHCMLGVPIVVKGVCIGVAWLKYRRDRINVVAHRFMDVALGFAAHAGLVLELIQQATLRSETDATVSLDGRHIAAGIQARWEANSNRVVRSAVASESVGAVLGGDFYALKTIDQNTVGIILLDGEGYGVAGSLNMLPLMSTFESVGPSYSATHVISQLATTAKAVGTRATALYAIVSHISGRKWLTVASAGHHGLIWFGRDEMDRWTYRFLPESTGAMLGHPLDEPLMEERYRLSLDDVLVAYTDGIAEHGESFGENQVCQVLMSLLCNGQSDPQEIANAILAESRVRQGALRDDATVCVLQIL